MLKFNSLYKHGEETELKAKAKLAISKGYTFKSYLQHSFKVPEDK